jgi:hypothetical protein
MNATINKILLALNFMDKHLTYSLVIYYRFNKTRCSMIPKYKIAKWETRKKKQKDGSFKEINKRLFELSCTHREIMEYLLNELNNYNVDIEIDKNELSEEGGEHAGY